MARRIVVEAGDSTLGLFDANGGVVSEASHASALEARAMVCASMKDKLTGILPDVPVFVVNEHKELPTTDNLWVIDPLDGLQAFAEGRNEYCVTAAFIKKGEPVLGIIYAPATGELYAAAGPDSALRWHAETNREKSVRMRGLQPKGMFVIADPDQIGTDRLERFLANQMVARIIPLQGALKFCMMAGGKADLCPCAHGQDLFALAAGDAILRGANGCIFKGDGKPVSYRTREMPPELMAASQPWLEAWFALGNSHPPGCSDSNA
jgi:3'(2'), 5'-bisphosphate nucleotidase